MGLAKTCLQTCADCTDSYSHACAKSHLGICSPLIHCVVSNNLLADSEGPNQTARIPRLIGALCCTFKLEDKFSNGAYVVYFSIIIIIFRKKFKKACDTIHDHSDKIIKERKKLLKTEDKSSRNIDFLDILLTAKVFEPQSVKTYILICVPNGDSNQPAHLSSLIRFFVASLVKTLLSKLDTIKYGIRSGSPVCHEICNFLLGNYTAFDIFQKVFFFIILFYYLFIYLFILHGALLSRINLQSFHMIQCKTFGRIYRYTKNIILFSSFQINYVYLILK